MFQVSTDKLLKLKFGKNERNFPIKLVSDAKAVEADISQYITAVKAVRQRPLMKKEAGRMRRRQDDLVNNYTYTTQDIENNLQKRKKKGQSTANLALEQTRSLIAVEAAKAALSEAQHQLKIAEDDQAQADARRAIANAEKELEEGLEELKDIAEKAKSRTGRFTSRSRDQQWAKVNRRNIEKNQRTDLGVLKPKEAQAKDSEAKKQFDPFARRKVKPKILWEVGQKDENDESKEAEGAKIASSNQDKEKENEATPNLVQEHQEKAAALSESHQFAIDEEVLAQTSFTNGIAGLTAKKAAKKRVRKGLSLAEYQEKKTAGTL